MSGQICDVPRLWPVEEESVTSGTDRKMSESENLTTRSISYTLVFNPFWNARLELLSM